ncbi:MAG: hypothetical protein LBG43_02140 [Treponema sp.]|nr:hypothetical protein [Treponema sp.]
MMSIYSSIAASIRGKHSRLPSLRRKVHKQAFIGGGKTFKNGADIRAGFHWVKEKFKTMIAVTSHPRAQVFHDLVNKIHFLLNERVVPLKAIVQYALDNSSARVVFVLKEL